MNLKKIKLSFVGVGLFIILFSVLFVHRYIYKPHQSIQASSVHFEGKASVFKKKVTDSPKKWLGKTIVLTGTITNVAENAIILDNLFYCQLYNTSKNPLKKQTQITIKGIMIGYDHLLNEVKLNQCIVSH